MKMERERGGKGGEAPQFTFLATPLPDPTRPDPRTINEGGITADADEDVNRHVA